MKRKFKTVMVIKSTNINKTNNGLLPQIIKLKKDHDTYADGNPSVGLG